MLRKRLQTFTEQREKLKSEIDNDTELSRRFVSRMNEMKPELKRLSKEREHLRKYDSVCYLLL